MKLTINSNSCKGYGNTNNEDYCYFKQFSQDSVLIVLADGMGGLSFGHIASKLVAQSISDFVDIHIFDMQPNTLLQQAINRANEVIRKECYHHKCKMGAAVALLFIQGQRAFYTGLGNVRLYRNMENNFIQLSTDHVYSPTLYGTFLTKCINGKPMEEKVAIQSIDIQYVSRFLLCTDGCYTNASKDDLAKLKAKHLTSEDFEDDNSCIEVTIKE